MKYWKINIYNSALRSSRSHWILAESADAAVAQAIDGRQYGDYGQRVDTHDGCSTGVPTSVEVDSPEGKALTLRDSMSNAQTSASHDSYVSRHTLR